MRLPNANMRCAEVRGTKICSCPGSVPVDSRPTTRSLVLPTEDGSVSVSPTPTRSCFAKSDASTATSPSPAASARPATIGNSRTLTAVGGSTPMTLSCATRSATGIFSFTGTGAMRCTSGVATAMPSTRSTLFRTSSENAWL